MKKRGFTLIELLIVVAIIAILAAIAVPNFLEAQTRAKVSRCKNDLRTVTVALESYMVDANNFPYPRLFPVLGTGAYFIGAIVELTTPVAYLTSVGMIDPFSPKNYWTWPGSGDKLPYAYNNYGGMNYDVYTGTASGIPRKKAYYVGSFGPDRVQNGANWAVSENGSNLPMKPEYFGAGLWAGKAWDTIYDPTNGTISPGDICRFGGEVRGPTYGG
jgi:prepilin-type N-terminal cleavage/methylation domain-containing protein